MVSDEQLKKNKYRRKKVMLKRVHTKGMVALVMVVVILMALGGQVFRITKNPHSVSPSQEVRFS